MIILDSNVLSALMGEAPDPAIVAWLDAQPRSSMWTSAITVLEIRFGLETMADGRRREFRTTAFRRLIDGKLERRIAGFDAAAAEASAILMARRQTSGRSGELRDGMIAGIALARRAILATRNVKHFDDAGLTLVNPWQP